MDRGKRVLPFFENEFGPGVVRHLRHSTLRCACDAIFVTCGTTGMTARLLSAACRSDLFRRMVATKIFCHFKRRASFTTRPFGFADDISSVVIGLIDQMIQAARSGKQNILEGSAGIGTSKKTEVKLTSVARASLEELLEDYRDFLACGACALWEKNSREAMFVRKLGRRGDVTYETYRTYIETRPPEVAANIIICLIHQTNYLLDQQIRQLEKAFVTEGGLSERMTQARLAERKRRRTDETYATDSDSCVASVA